MSLTVFKNDKQIVILMTRKEGEHLGALLDACLDVPGNLEGSDIGLTNRQLSKAEDNMIALSYELM